MTMPTPSQYREAKALGKKLAVDGTPSREASRILWDASSELGLCERGRRSFFTTGWTKRKIVRQAMEKNSGKSTRDRLPTEIVDSVTGTQELDDPEQSDQGS